MSKKTTPKTATMQDGGGPMTPENETWWRVGMRQLSGMLLLVFARRSLKPKITNVSTGTVGCGVGGFGGNKGAVAVSMNLFHNRILMLTSHFAAHQVRRNRCLLFVGVDLFQDFMFFGSIC